MDTREITDWLRQRNVTDYVFADMLVSDFDFAKSLRNQARFAPLDAEVAERYTIAAKRGAVFPPVVVVRESNDKFTAIDGNHRMVAFRNANRATTSAVIVNEIEPHTLTLLRYEANAKHGLPLTVAERLSHAEHLVTLGADPAQAASALGVQLKSLRQRLSAAEARKRMGENKAKHFNRSALDRLSTVNEKPIFDRLATVLQGESADKINTVVREVNRARTNKEKIAVIDSFVAERGEIEKLSAGHVFTSPTTVGMIYRACGMVQAVYRRDDELAALNGQIGEQERVVLRERSIAAAAALTKIASLLS